MIAITFEVADLATLTSGTDVTDQVEQAGGRVVLNEEGSGFLRIPYGETLTPSPIGRAVVVKFDGTAVHAWVGEAVQPVEVDRGEERVMFTEYSGRGLGGLLDRYRFRPTLGPRKSPWSLKRTFSAHSPEYTDWTGWDPAVELGAVGDESYRWTGTPDGFPSFTTQRVGPTGTDDVEAPAGRWWYEDEELTLAEDELVVYFLAGDNQYSAWVDGMKIGEVSGDRDAASGFTETFRSPPLPMSAGTHRFGGQILNLNVDYSDPGYGEGSTDDGNPTMLVGVAYTVDGRGRLLTKVWETTAAGNELSYPADPPGPTITEVVDVAVDENVADGIAPTFTTSATGSFDELETVTVDTASSLLKALRDDWSGLYLDWHVPPDDLELQTWPAGDRGSASGVTFDTSADPSTGNLYNLESVTVDADTDCLLVSWKGGWLRVPDSGGERMGYLPTDAESLREAEVRAAYALAQPGQPTQITCGITPRGTGDVPLVDFDCGDTITVGDHASQRVMEIGYSFGEEQSGEPTFDIAVSYRLPTKEGRLEKTLRTSGGGGLGGFAPSTPTFEPDRFGSTIRSGDVTFRPLPPYVVGPADVEKRPVGSGNLYAVAVTAKTAGTTDTEFEFLVNDTDVLTGNGVLPDTELFALIPVDPIVWVEGNASRLTVDLTTVGSGVDGLLFEPRFL